MPHIRKENPTEKKKRKSLPTYHVQFSLEDNETVQAKATATGLKVSTYLRLVGLGHDIYASPPPLDVAPILTHTEKLNELVATVRAIAAHPHAERWKYESDIERIDTILAEILESEIALIETIRDLNGR